MRKQAQSARMLFTKEISMALLNGLIWGGVLGLIAFPLSMATRRRGW